MIAAGARVSRVVGRTRGSGAGPSTWSSSGTSCLSPGAASGAMATTMGVAAKEEEEEAVGKMEMKEKEKVKTVVEKEEVEMEEIKMAGEVEMEEIKMKKMAEIKMGEVEAEVEKMVKEEKKVKVVQPQKVIFVSGLSPIKSTHLQFLFSNAGIVHKLVGLSWTKQLSVLRASTLYNLIN